MRLAAACGADEQGVAATTAATGVAAVAVPALFVYVCLPLLHAGQEVMEWEEDHLPWSCCWCARALPVAVPDAKKTHAISGPQRCKILREMARAPKVDGATNGG